MSENKADERQTEFEAPQTFHYSCKHVKSNEFPCTVLVTCISVPPSRAELRTRSRLCSICAHVICAALEQVECTTCTP